MLTYLWGDVLSILAGDYGPGKLFGDTEPTQGMWLFIAAIMLTPIVMVVLSLTLKYPAIRWANIVVPILVVVFNLFGLPYPGAYENFPDLCELCVECTDHMVCMELGGLE
jgi:hypothetical protein